MGGLPLAIQLLGGYMAAPESVLFLSLNQATLAEVGDPARRLALAQQQQSGTAGKTGNAEGGDWIKRR